MKLCHVVPSLQQQHGGPSKSVRALCRALARAGHSVELFTTAPDAPDEGIDEPDGGLCVRTFRRGRPDRVTRSAGMQRALMRCEADIIHHHALWLRTLHYANLRAQRTATPLVVSPRGMMSGWAWRHHRWRKAAAQALIHPGAFESTAGWHATSPEEQAEIRALGFNQPTCVAPNGVDVPEPAEIAAAADYWRIACPETATRPTALFYGRFHQKKRVVELIDVWLERAPPDWLLLLVGLPEDYTPEMLEQYAHKLSGAGRVRAFAGTSRLPPYAVASLFLLPSHTENFGMAVAEAMAHGVPTLVTDSTPWHGINTDDRGWCVPWNDYGAAIESATNEPLPMLRERGQRAKAWVVREYSWDAAARKLGEFYQSLISPAHQPIERGVSTQ